MNFTNFKKLIHLNVNIILQNSIFAIPCLTYRLIHLQKQNIRLRNLQPLRNFMHLMLIIIFLKLNKYNERMFKLNSLCYLILKECPQSCRTCSEYNKCESCKLGFHK